MPSTQIATTLQTTCSSSAIGRAHLLVALVLAEDNKEKPQGLTAAAGYEMPQKVKDNEDDERDNTNRRSEQTFISASGVSKADETGAPQADGKVNEVEPQISTEESKPQPENRDRIWAVTERKPLPKPEPGSVEEFDPNLDNLPLQLAEVMGEPDAPPPPWHSMLPTARLMPALKRNFPASVAAA